jgi:hypothetical protein
MALDDLYAGSIDQAVRNRATLTPVTPKPEQSFWGWGVAKAPFTGMAAGALEAGAFWSELAGAFGDVQASYDYSGMLPVGVGSYDQFDPEEAKAAQKRLMSGDSFSNPVGDDLRDKARWLGPDQQTASTAEGIMFGLSKTVTKAVGYSLLGGPLTGAALTGADEGVTEADNLKRQGVDIGTRTKVGAVTGLATGAGVAIPVAGRTITGTLGLAAAGGPGLFMAQQQVTKAILNGADYGTLADQYDPFDPVGLAVSFLAPAAFGGLAHGVRARAARAEMRAPAADEAAQPIRTDRDVQDAARVQAVRDVVDSWSLADPADVRAANDALLSVMRASGQLADGLPVSVSDSFPMRDAYAARAIERLIGRAEASRADLLPTAEGVAEPGAVRGMRAEINDLAPVRDRAQDQTTIQARAKEIQAETPRTSYKQALSAAKKEITDQANEAATRIAALEDQINANAEAVEARRALKILDAQIERMKADRAAIDAPATELTPVAAALRQMEKNAGRASPRGARSPESPAESAPVTATPAAARTDVDPLVPAGRLPSGTAESAGSAHIASRMAELQATHPDAPVRLEGDAEGIPLSEALRRLDDEAARADADADLLTVAAACALSPL